MSKGGERLSLKIREERNKKLLFKVYFTLSPLYLRLLKVQVFFCKCSRRIIF